MRFFNYKFYTRPFFTMVILIISAISLFITSLDMAMSSLAVPFIAKTYNAVPSDASLILSSYYLALTSIMILGGKLSDLIGPIKVTKYGGLLFIFGSALSGVAPSLTIMVIFRFIQGAGGALLLPLHGSMIRKYLANKYLGRYFGLMTFVAGLAFVLGYTLGGILIKIFVWRAIFFVNVPTGILMLFLIRKIKSLDIKKESPINSQIVEKFDIGMLIKKINIFNFGFLHNSIVFIVIFLLTFLLKQGYLLNFKDQVAIIVVIMLLCVVFSWSLYKTREKSTYSWLLNSKILIALCLTFIMNVVFDGINFIMPYYLNNIRHVPSNYMGLILAILPIFSMIVAPFIGNACDRYGADKISKISIFLLIGGLLILVTCNPSSGLLKVICALMLFGVAIAMFFTANIHFVMLQIKNGYEGVASALKSSVSYFGGVVGFSIFSQMLTAKHSIITSYSSYFLMSGFKYACEVGVILGLVMLSLSYLQTFRKV